jgi:hypothetical protein
MSQGKGRGVLAVVTGVLLALMAFMLLNYAMGGWRPLLAGAILVTAAVVGGLTCAAYLALSRRSPLTAPGFVLAGAGGARAVLDLQADGPVLEMTDAAGRPRLRLGVDGSGPWVRLLDERGTARVCLELLPDRPGAVQVRDEQGTERTFLGMTPHGGPALILYSAAETPQVELYALRGGPAWGLLDSQGRRRARAQITREGAQLSLFDEAEKPVWQAGPGGPGR